MTRMSINKRFTIKKSEKKRTKGGGKRSSGAEAGSYSIIGQQREEKEAALGPSSPLLLLSPVSKTSGLFSSPFTLIVRFEVPLRNSPAVAVPPPVSLGPPKAPGICRRPESVERRSP